MGFFFGPDGREDLSLCCSRCYFCCLRFFHKLSMFSLSSLLNTTTTTTPTTRNNDSSLAHLLIRLQELCVEWHIVDVQLVRTNAPTNRKTWGAGVVFGSSQTSRVSATTMGQANETLPVHQLAMDSIGGSELVNWA